MSFAPFPLGFVRTTELLDPLANAPPEAPTSTVFRKLPPDAGAVGCQVINGAVSSLGRMLTSASVASIDTAVGDCVLWFVTAVCDAILTVG